MAVVPKIILTIGFFSIFHAALSAVQHRSYLRINELQFTRLPTDIIVQTLISLVIIMYGVLNVAGDFKVIKASAGLDNKSWETFRNITSFYTFSHRGRSIAVDYES
ncbi:hypothetical protein ABEB36_008140 [Hypothenemus hampei]|uniref:Membrane magnesium transporter n=1 Tax=Hypothenemus hampei TaxID=57062 RepID=A0ABD1EKZ2_HYPHA